MSLADSAKAAEPPLKIPAWLQAVLLAALWLVTHPYRGVIHDGRLYTAQALSQLDPRVFADDLFFRFGSQDSFTIFSIIYKPLIALAGPAVGHALAVGLGQALWFVALILLMRALFGLGLQAFLAAAACIGLSSIYGGLNVFSYGESFATPRLFAEAMVMIAVAFGLRRRHVLAGLVLIGAAAIHPIMALTGMGFLAILVALHDRRAWVLIGAAAAAGLGLAFAGVAPFSRALEQFDPAWFQIIEQRSASAFVGGWRWPDILRLAETFAVLAGGWIIASREERPVLMAAGLAAVASLLVTLFGADLAHNILVVNAQPWRMLWLATLFANAWLAILAWRSPPKSLSRELLLAALLISLAVGFLPVARPAASVVVMLAVGVMLLERWRGGPAPALVRLPARALMILAVCYLGYAAYWESVTPDFLAAMIGVGLLAALVATGAWLALRGADHRLAVLLSMILLAAAVSTVDRRPAWTRFVEDPTPEPNLEAFVGGNHNLYWESSLDLMWLKLRMPSYYSCSQGAGAMFFRGTAMEYARRGQALSGLNSEDFLEDGHKLCAPKPQPLEHGPRSVAQLAAACRALPELDAIVLFRPVPEAHAAAIWGAPAERLLVRRDQPKPMGGVERVSHYYKYPCAELREGAPRN